MKASCALYLGTVSSDDDELFTPRVPAPAETTPPAAPHVTARTDARRVGGVVAGILLAHGGTTAQEVERANDGLRQLGRPPLDRTDFVAESPERLAPLVPIELRAGLLDLLYHLAGDEPIRRRLADAYATLWHEQPEASRAAEAGIAGRALVDRQASPASVGPELSAGG